MPPARRKTRARAAELAPSSWKHVELAEREAEVLASLSHPSVPAYVTHFEENGVLFLVMERIEGKTLAQLRLERALSQRDVLALC